MSSQGFINYLRTQSLQVKQALNNLRRLSFESSYGLRAYATGGTVTVSTLTTITNWAGFTATQRSQLDAQLTYANNFRNRLSLAGIKPQVDLPSWEIMAVTPSTAASGACSCNDLRGTGRYIYFMFAYNAFYRYDTYANSWQQLASAPSATIGAGTCLCYDPSRDRVWCLIANTGGSPTFQYYDCTTNAWTARGVTNLPSSWGTDASICHTCSTYNAAGNDDLLYLGGNNTTSFYQYSISGNSWTTKTAATGAFGTGTQLCWMPGWNIDRILQLRGGSYAHIYYYSIPNNNWANIAYVPSTEGYSTGTMGAPRGLGTQFFIHKDSSGRIHAFDVTSAHMEPQSFQWLLTYGTGHVGNRFNYVKTADNVEYLYLQMPSLTYLLRTGLTF